MNRDVKCGACHKCLEGRVVNVGGYDWPITMHVMYLTNPDGVYNVHKNRSFGLLRALYERTVYGPGVHLQANRSAGVLRGSYRGAMAQCG